MSVSQSKTYLALSVKLVGKNYQLQYTELEYVDTGSCQTGIALSAALPVVMRKCE